MGNTGNRRKIVRTHALYSVVKIASYVVLALGAGAITYAGIMGLTYWSGIGV